LHFQKIDQSAKFEEEIVPEKTTKPPVYKGMVGHRDVPGGFEVWVPSDWTQTRLKPDHYGMLFSPYKDDFNTSLLIEKHTLKYSVTADDIPMLLEAFKEGMMALPGIEVESTEETLSNTINVFDARFTFLEGDQRRKRWVRNIYWGTGQLVMIAQGRTPEDYDYWLPMFFNSMTTTNII
jgi:hypothetical protein